MTDILEKSQARQRLRSLSEALDSGALKQVARILNGGLSPSDIAHLLESSPPRQRALLWNLVDKDLEGEVLQYLSDDIRGYFLSQLNAQELADIIEDFESDDLADLLQQLPDTVIQEVLETMDEQDRQRVEEVLSYPEDTAGGLMNTDTITVRPDISIDVVLRYLRRHRTLPPMTDSLIVVSRRDDFIGMLPITKMLVSNPASTVREVMDTDIEPIPVSLSDTKVATLFERYDLISAPVVNEEGRLLGRITIDDVVDVIDKEAQEDLLRLVGVDQGDLYRAVISTASARFRWLFINLLTAIFASIVISFFDATIEQIVALAILMPIVASMGGNAGTQALTVAVRAIATHQLSGTNTMRVIWKETLVGAINGVLFAVITGLTAAFWFSSATLGMVIASAMIINLLVAGLFGAGIPIVLNTMGSDPAVSSTVLLTTITDVVGFLAFLGLAALFLI